MKTVIIGANGAGKSTMFYHFNGILKPKEGTVYYDGKPLEYTRDALSDLRNKVSIVVQNPDEQIFSSTVEEDVAFGPLNMSIERDEVERRIVTSLEKVGMLEYRERPTVKLSYGQRKRVALAGALACEPEVLILDEPTAGLDPQMSQEVMELVNELCLAGTTVIISTHDVDLAYTWAEEIHVLRKGKLIYSGSPEPFFANTEEVALSGLVKPHTFSINSTFESLRGRDEAPYPRTNSQLLAKLSTPDAKIGVIRMIPFDKEISEIPQVCGNIGIYGSRTRRAVRESKTRVDYYFNAIEGCCLDAMSGLDSVLVYDIELESLVRDTISVLGKFGKVPEMI
ncbi:MAG: energy-coupling factor ABC transporter ATP-binding protein [archaeon]|nr:energy-coupling factor ABC transporter ATP-binding protein [archaeon]